MPPEKTDTFTGIRVLKARKTKEKARRLTVLLSREQDDPPFRKTYEIVDELVSKALAEVLARQGLTR